VEKTAPVVFLQDMGVSILLFAKSSRLGLFVTRNKIETSMRKRKARLGAWGRRSRKTLSGLGLSPARRGGGGDEIYFSAFPTDGP
jgi:hypothetical protein